MQSLIGGLGELLMIEISSRFNVHEIMWTLDAKQTSNHRLDCSHGKRKNFPTTSLNISYKGQFRDASSEVCVNHWAYMNIVFINTCLCHDIDDVISLCINTYTPERPPSIHPSIHLFVLSFLVEGKTTLVPLQTLNKQTLKVLDEKTIKLPLS